MDRLKRFLATGVSCFIDLTEPDEAPAYEAYLPFATPDGRRIAYLREPIPDHDVPAGRETMTRILRMIDDALAAGSRRLPALPRRRRPQLRWSSAAGSRDTARARST